MKMKKEDLSYAARIADGMVQGHKDKKQIKPKKKYKFKSDDSTLSGMTRSYYEEDQSMQKIMPVSKILKSFLEEIENDINLGEAAMDDNKTLLEDYKLIKLAAQKGIKEVLAGHKNTDIMNDILGIAEEYKGNRSLGENVASTQFTANKMGSAYNEGDHEANIMKLDNLKKKIESKRRAGLKPNTKDIEEYEKLTAIVNAPQNLKFLTQKEDLEDSGKNNPTE